MALVKLNVLHLHLTEDQGFRIESKKFPRLHELGSDGNYFTHDQIREIIAYAQARGIRVMPEFDIPGHATSWVVGYPDLASAPGPYQIERRWGIFDPTLDPTNEKVYELLDGFLGEMAALFPDPYLHIGGDEVNGKQWKANEKIQAFIKEKNLKDLAGLQAYFNRRVLAIVTKHGKKLVGWDEILHPDLPKDAIIHSWRGPKGLAAAAGAGHATILSNGYYIDLLHPASQHYVNDPLPANTPLSAEDQKRVLGGEATMWAEWTSPETIDSRIWPRTAAIAERLWSPREVASIPEMYRRLAIVNRRLEEAGLTHEKNAEALLRIFTGDAVDAVELDHVRAFIALIEPLKEYRRGRAQKGSTQFTPLTGIADCARADAPAAREFSQRVEAALFARGADERDGFDQLINRYLLPWQENAKVLADGIAPKSLRLREVTPLITALHECAAIGITAVETLRDKKEATETWRTAQFAALTRVTNLPSSPVELAMVPALRLLIAAASVEPQRATLAPADWRKLVEQLAAPPPPPKKPEPAH
jgi:hexosaminidase